MQSKAMSKCAWASAVLALSLAVGGAFCFGQPPHEAGGDRFNSGLASPKGPWDIKSGAYRFRLTTRAGDPKYDKGMHVGYSAGRVVSELEVWYKSEKMIVHRSTFADLSEVKSVRAQVAGKTCWLKIFGSDAGESYYCGIKFKEGDAILRIVKNGETRNVMEAAQYSY